MRLQLFLFSFMFLRLVHNGLLHVVISIRLLCLATDLLLIAVGLK